MAKIISKESTKKSFSPFKDYWNKNNLYITLVGLLTVFLGYYLLSFEPWNNFVSLSLAPVVLLIGYLIIIPLGILFIKKTKN